MKYEKTEWISGQTALSATNFNHIEDGLEDIFDEVADLQTKHLSKHHIVLSFDNGDFFCKVSFDIFMTWETAISSIQMLFLRMKNKTFLANGTMLDAGDYDVYPVQSISAITENSSNFFVFVAQSMDDTSDRMALTIDDRFSFTDEVDIVF